MSMQDELLLRIEKTLGDLLDNARKMLQKSLQEFSPTELMSLQALQDQLMDRLVAADTALRAKYPDVMESGELPVVKRIEKGLEEFQVLNREFIDNVKRQKPVIDFETERAPKGKHHAPPVKDRHSSNSAHPTGGHTTVHTKKEH